MTVTDIPSVLDRVSLHIRLENSDKHFRLTGIYIILLMRTMCQASLTAVSHSTAAPVTGREEFRTDVRRAVSLCKSVHQ